ncbi:MAG: hypothetical protein ABW155_20150 [Candidatus Thiodiazotropha sp.]
MSGTEEGAWFSRRSMLCEKGFTFDYSYRWFYEDGFGKDYQILNLPDFFDETRVVYLTACLLMFYQQLRIYQEQRGDYEPFNMEKRCGFLSEARYESEGHPG